MGIEKGVLNKKIGICLAPILNFNLKIAFGDFSYPQNVQSLFTPISQHPLQHLQQSR